jgi:N-terminal domain of anti-restriction factor ArdC
MKVEEVKQITSEALQELVAALEQRRSETLTAYLKAMSRFSNHSSNNLFLIVRHRPNARRLAGYQTWQKVGRCVRKGEKGIAIIAPMVRHKSDETTRNQSKANDLSPDSKWHTSFQRNKPKATRCLNSEPWPAIPQATLSAS